MAAQRRRGRRPFLARSLRADPDRRAELTAATTVGTSRSRWLGQEPRVITTYEYDDTGRLVRSISEQEPEWTDEDRGWLLAHLGEQAGVCPGCGNHLDECADPKTAGRWRIEHYTCEACRVLQADAENLAQEKVRQRGLYTVASLA